MSHVPQYVLCYLVYFHNVAYSYSHFTDGKMESYKENRHAVSSLLSEIFLPFSGASTLVFFGGHAFPVLVRVWGEASTHGILLSSR